MSETKNTPQDVNKFDLELYNLYTDFVSLIKRRLVLIIVICAIGIGGGTAYYVSQTPYYFSKMAVRYTILDADDRDNKISLQTVIALINELNEQIGTGNYEKLAGMLNLSVDEVKQLKQFKAQKLEYVFGFERQDILISIFLYDKSVAEKLEAGLMGYLESNEIIDKNFNAYKALLRENEKVLTDKINLIDSLIQVQKSTSELNNEEAIDDKIKTEISSLEAHNTRFWIQRKLELLGNVEMVIPIEVQVKPYHPDPFKLGIYIVVFIVFTNIVLIALLEFYAKIKRVGRQLHQQH